MQKIKSHNFIISIPDKYKVVKHNPYLLNLIFFIFFPFKLFWPKLAKFLKKHPPDLESLKGFYPHEVKMGEHNLIFYTRITEEKPEELSDFIESQTGVKPVLDDYSVKDFNGKKYGGYSDTHTCIEWRIKKNGCMICLNLQGMGKPSEDIQEGVSFILNNLEYVEGNQ